MTTKFRTDLVNTMGGVFAGIAFLAIFLPKVDYSKGFWDWMPQVAMIGVGTAFSGFIFAGVINYLQGANHQKASSSNAEEKRSGKASIIVAICVCFILPFFQFKDPTVLWIIAAVLAALTGYLWKIHSNIFPDYNPIR